MNVLNFEYIKYLIFFDKIYKISGPDPCFVCELNDILEIPVCQYSSMSDKCIYIYMYVIQNIAMKNTLKFSHQVLNMQSYCKRSSKFQPNYEMWSLSSSWNQLTNERFKLFLSCSVHMKWWCTIQLQWLRLHVYLFYCIIGMQQEAWMQGSQEFEIAWLAMTSDPRPTLCRSWCI